MNPENFYNKNLKHKIPENIKEELEKTKKLKFYNQFGNITKD